MKQTLTTLLASVAFCLSAGCSIQVPVEMDQMQTQTADVHGSAVSKVVIQVPEEMASKVHTEQGLVAVGMAHKWNVEVGDAIQNSAKPFFSQYFPEVELQSGHWRDLRCDDCSLIIRPTVESIEISSVLMQADITLRLKVYNAMGTLVMDERVNGKSALVGVERVSVGLAGMWVPFLGDAMGSYVISDSVEEAFSNVYAELDTLMVNHLRNGALARTWLPADMIQKKDYGQYEFAAERLAKSNGCNLQSDGLRLHKKGIVELYDAYCYGQDLFQIECAYGTCAILDTPKTAASALPTQTIAN